MPQGGIRTPPAVLAYTGVRPKKEVHTHEDLRSALTGLAGGPSVHDVMAALGREESLKRIERAAR